MKVLITGATGLVGKQLGKSLAIAGHDIHVLTRNPQKAAMMTPFPATFFSWSQTHLPLEALQGVDTIVHLAGESIAASRWSARRKELILSSRVNSTNQLVTALRELSKRGEKLPKQVISASAIGIYGDSLKQVFNEESPSGEGFLADVCRQWEQAAKGITELGINLIHPRIGIVLSREGGALEKMLLPFTLGFGGAVGSGKQWMSWIHHEDLTGLLQFFIDHPALAGVYNAVAPQAASNYDFSKQLANSLGFNLFLPVPGFILKLALGEMSQLVLNGQNVSASKLMEAGYQFKYPTLDKALNELCSPLKNSTKMIIAEQWVPHKLDDVFTFFCNEKNLEKLTPNFLNFKVLKKSTEQIQQGTLIDYRLGLHGIPVKWRTRIEDWQPQQKFVDTQLKGPYKLWHHTHEFTVLGKGTLMTDRVRYQVPLGRLGDMVAGLKVKSDVSKIFHYRREVVAKLFQ